MTYACSQWWWRPACQSGFAKNCRGMCVFIYVCMYIYIYIWCISICMCMMSACERICVYTYMHIIYASEVYRRRLCLCVCVCVYACVCRSLSYSCSSHTMFKVYYACIRVILYTCSRMCAWEQENSTKEQHKRAVRACIDKHTHTHTCVCVCMCMPPLRQLFNFSRFFNVYMHTCTYMHTCIHT
jgi:hypothetical protein